MKKGIFKKITAFLFAAMFIFLSCGNIVFAADNVSSVEETANVAGAVEPLAANSPIENGYYVLKNPHTGRFVDVDNDGKTPNGDKLEQWDYDGDPTQVWIFSRIPSGTYAGYYNILQSQSMLYMTVKDNSDKNDADVILSNYVSGSSGQAWKIEYANNGQYKITPACGEAAGRVLCVNNSVFGANVNGLDIKSRTYSNDSNYKDEWLLYPYKTITFNSRYDESYYNYCKLMGFDVANHIDENEKFVSDAIGKWLPVKLNVTGTSNIYRKSTTAELHNGSCTTGAGGCGLCPNHHKNFTRLSNDIWFGEKLLPNTLYISWMRRPGEICEYINGKHEVLWNVAAGIVVDIDSTGKETNRPIIQIHDTDHTPSEAVCSSLNFIHELGHELGLDELYYTTHKDNSNYDCVMMIYNSNKAQGLYNKIKKGTSSPFCDDCLEFIWNNIVNLSFNGN